MLDLVRPVYEKTAAYGHFGREEPEFSWEKTDKAAALPLRLACNVPLCIRSVPLVTRHARHAL